MPGESLAQLIAGRVEKLEALRHKGVVPYPSRSSRSHFSRDILDGYEELEGQEVVVAGRLMSMRSHGALSFGHIQDSKGRLQLFLRQAVLGDGAPGTLAYSDLHLLDVGDFVEAQGTVTKTQKGEVSVLPTRLTLLSKSLRPLPDKWSGIQSPEVIRRKRYLHTIMEPETKDRYRHVSEMVFSMRGFLHREGFNEFQTPILQPMYGGGTAKPFTTWLNAFDCRMYLAISHELYLKRLIIAGYDNVFTVGRYFRNEGVDYTHNPEFSMLETMSAYRNYEYNMDLVERLFRHVSQEVFRKEEYEWRGHKIDMVGEWRRISVKDAVKEFAGLDFEEWKTAEDGARALASRGIQEPVGSPGEALALAYEELVAPQIINPTIVYGHPVEISPLAKPMADDPRFAERFEIVIGGMECGDNWSEQNDPIALRARWLEARNLASSLGHESHPMDTDFLEALEYGLPPTTGLGPGIERMAMLFTEQSSINDVLFFPTVKPLGEEEEIAQEETGPLHFSFQQFEELCRDGVLQPIGQTVGVHPSLEVWPSPDRKGHFRAIGSIGVTGFLRRPMVVSGYVSSSEEPMGQADESRRFWSFVADFVQRVATIDQRVQFEITNRL